MDVNTEDIDTRGFIHHLLDYPTVFGTEMKVDEALELIKEIPSNSILLTLAIINFGIYLNDVGSAGQSKQNELIKWLLPFSSYFTKQIVRAYKTSFNEDQWPTIFYRYSNLIFFDKILSNYNNKTFKESTPKDREDIVATYLVINSIVNRRIDFTDNEFEKALAENKIETILMPQFIYQKDYTSNSDYTNQITRSYYFFKFLEEHEKFKLHIGEYYTRIGVQGYHDLIEQLVRLFRGLMKEKTTSNPVITPNESDEKLKGFLQTISINPTKLSYKGDDSFKQLRNQMFFLLPNGKYVLLDMSFLIDYLYKAHVFALNDFMREKGIKDFLSIKSHEFTEKIYFELILKRCFKFQKTFSESQIIKKNKKPLTDFVVKNGNDIMLIEFKDTLFSSIAKNSADKEIIQKALDEKFLKNKDDKAKGIGQLMNAVNYLNENPKEFIDFDLIPTSIIYPVVVYTDNTFGYDGINKIYKSKFEELVESSSIMSFKLYGVTFINLNFFEIEENYFTEAGFEIFEIIRKYHEHTGVISNSITPFEVFATAYLKRGFKPTTSLPYLYSETIEKIEEYFKASKMD